MEVVVMTRLRTAVLVPALAALLLLPTISEAQGRRAVRVARPRTTVAVGVGVRPYYRSYYRPYYYYDPFFFGSFYYSPFYYPGDRYYYGQYPYYGRGYYDTSASLRLQVSPRQTEVYIDGYYAGTVDDFDGVFQRLHVDSGEHDLQLYLPGHRSFSEKVYLQPYNTFRVRHTMEPLRGGEAEPVRPTAQTPPQRRSAVPERPLPPRPRDRDRDADRDRDRDRDSDRDRDRDRRESAPDLGTVSLRVQPADAVIMIDGDRWQGPTDSDRLVIQMPAGTHNVEIRKDGYRTYITDINVRRGESTPLNVALTKQ
jgi:PEGA domain-containing protein